MWKTANVKNVKGTYQDFLNEVVYVEVGGASIQIALP